MLVKHWEPTRGVLWKGRDRPQNWWDPFPVLLASTLVHQEALFHSIADPNNSTWTYSKWRAFARACKAQDLAVKRQPDGHLDGRIATLHLYADPAKAAAGGAANAAQAASAPIDLGFAGEWVALQEQPDQRRATEQTGLVRVAELMERPPATVPDNSYQFWVLRFAREDSPGAKWTFNHRAMTVSRNLLGIEQTLAVLPLK
jgi:hypothetical protein